jgi:hypothetical protein
MTAICHCCGQPIKVARAKAPKAPTFKGYDDWAAAHLAAKLAACAALGDHWAILPGASVIARVPAAWVSCKVFGRTSKSPRDMRIPAARFWPNGLLPRGPEYALEGPREPELTSEAMAAWRKFQTITDVERRNVATLEWMANNPTHRPHGWTPVIVTGEAA